MRLSERTMLASLHLGLWTGQAVDRDVTEEVSESHKADPKDAGRYSKRLASPKFFREINSAFSVARATHKVLTLPWTDDGTRILSTMQHQHYTEQMRIIRSAKAEPAIKAFGESYEEIKREAKGRLGTMFDPEDYPTLEEVMSRFKFDVEISPTPDSGDFRAQLSDASVKAITKDIERRTNERVEAALADAFQRIHDVTTKMATKLRQYDPANKEGLFKDSLVQNIFDLADLLPGLNITDDQRLKDLASRLKLELTEHSPEALRVDAKVRNDVMKKADAIAKKVGQFLG